MALVDATMSTSGYCETLQKESVSALEKLVSFTLGVPADQRSEDVAHFMQMYNEIFLATNLACEKKKSGHNKTSLSTEGDISSGLTTLDKCMRKFREIFRKRFRGVFYLLRLDEVYQSASTESLRLLRKISKISNKDEEGRSMLEQELNERMTVEKKWLTKVNEWKRQGHFENIQAEAFQSFRATVENEFPPAYLDPQHQPKELNGNQEEMTAHFQEEEDLLSQLDHLTTSILDDFRQQIPPEENDALVATLENNLKKEFSEKVVRQAVAKNASNKEHATSVMTSVVEQCSDDYAARMASFLQKAPLVETSKVLEHHDLITSNLLETIREHAETFRGPLDFPVSFENSLNNLIHEHFARLVNLAHKDAHGSLTICSTRSKELIQSYVMNVAKICGEFGATSFVGALSEKMEQCLDSTTKCIQESTIVSANKVEELIQISKPLKILTTTEKADLISSLFENVKGEYRNRADEILEFFKRASPPDESFQVISETQIRREASQLLRDGIRTSLGPTVDTEFHEHQLFEYMSEYWTKSLQTVKENTDKSEVKAVKNKVEGPPKAPRKKKGAPGPAKKANSTPKKVVTNTTRDSKQSCVEIISTTLANKTSVLDQAKPEIEEKKVEITFKKRPKALPAPVVVTTSQSQVELGATPLLEKSSMSPIVFQMGSTRITTAVILDLIGPKVLENEFGHKFTPAVVALTKDNQFVYGHAALEALNSSEAGPWQWTSLQRHWWVANHIISSSSPKPWTHKVEINGGHQEITVEFLLGFIFRKLKESIESRMFSGEKCPAAVITVPFWLSSAQRLQMKDSARIAGFQEVYLVNESAAAAHWCVSVHEARSLTMPSLLILSENSDRVDVSIYAHSRMNYLRMLAHSGNYCLEEVQPSSKASSTASINRSPKQSKDAIISGSNPTSTSTTTSSVASPKSSRNFAGGESKEAVTHSVRQACKQAFAASKKVQKPNERSAVHEIIVVSQTPEKWTDLLETIGRDFGRKFGNVKQEEAVILGACSLSRRPKAIGHLIRDKVAYDLIGTSGNQPDLLSSTTIISKGEYGLPTRSKSHSITLLGGFTVSFFQTLGPYSNLPVNLPIGELTIASTTLPQDHAGQYFVPSLDISHEAIISLKNVNIFSEHDGNCVSLAPESYIWEPSNIPEDKMNELISFLENLEVLQRPNTASSQRKKRSKLSRAAKLARSRKVLARKCREMLDLLENDDTFLIKSELGKDLIANQIDEAIKFTEMTNATLEEVEKQVEVLSGVYTRYFQKHAKLQKQQQKATLTAPEGPPAQVDKPENPQKNINDSNNNNMDATSHM